jgi:CheY-like chemotaxis protein
MLQYLKNRYKRARRVCSACTATSRGGFAVAKILVADDNSNIQRMVGLALKDQGIEVVAVGNGEAAVRKITEIRPDLVLADVFMPVRNGYEVCQFVKQNPELAHIPVILLIGAFDPLDEQEAQRVGSDGVLKKPFVPPDPLITMVKNALQKAGVSLSGAGSQKTTSSSRNPSEAPKTSSMDLPAGPPKPSSPLAGLKFSRFTSPEPPAEPPAPALQEMSFVEEPAPPPPVTIAPSDNMMAFENLLGSTATEEPKFVAAAPEATSDADAEESLEVAEEREESEQVEDVAPAVPSWRRNAAEEQFTDDDSVGAVKDWRDSEVLQNTGRSSARETWEQNENESGFGAAKQVADEVPAELGAFATELSSLETASRSSHSVETFEPQPAALETGAPGFTAPREEFSSNSQSHEQSAIAEAPAVALEEVSAPDSSTHEVAAQQEVAVSADEFGRPEEATVESQESAHETAAVEKSVVTSEPELAEQHALSSQPAREVAPEEALLHDVLHELEQAKHEPAPVEEKIEPQSEEKTPEREPVNSWFSRPASPWDTEPHRPNPLAAAWGGSKQSAVAEPEPHHEPQPVAAAHDTPEHAAQHREEVSDSHGTNGHSTSHDIEEVIAAEPAALATPVPSTETSHAPAQPDVDDLVARVLAKMNPDVLQAVTREILKPMVAAILAEESKRKE